MSVYLGIDTSNYTTSVCLFDSDSGEVISKRKLLPVKDGFASIGLLDKYMAPATVKALTNTSFQLAEGGLFGFVSDAAPKAVIADGTVVPFTAENGYYTALCGEAGSPVEVSVEF